MQQAVLRHFPDAQSTYKFTHRDADVYFTRQCYERFVAAIPRAHAPLLFVLSPWTHQTPEFATLSLTPEERTWLQTACPYLEPAYLDYLTTYRFKPCQIQASFVPRAPASDEGRIEFEASGPWAEAILWEVPLMATLSEIYFTTVDRDWNDDGQTGASTCERIYRCVRVCRMSNSSYATNIQTLRTRRAQGWSRQAARSANLGRVADVRITFRIL